MEQGADRLRLREGVLLQEVCGRPVVLDVDSGLLFELHTRAAALLKELLSPGATVVAPHLEPTLQTRWQPSHLDVIAALEEAGLLVDADPPTGEA